MYYETHFVRFRIDQDVRRITRKHRGNVFLLREVLTRLNLLTALLSLSLSLSLNTLYIIPPIYWSSIRVKSVPITYSTTEFVYTIWH